ncbi:protein Wnt-10a-like [Ylistrum balloti]|uniref:protein Wnt-10a-like n=1 Tax=Ylistrum balloti TaxID=509963 RepID=UPI0029058590|nr:protein Wnt-10a-like [Ylistrum balloti]
MDVTNTGTCSRCKTMHCSNINPEGRRWTSDRCGRTNITQSLYHSNTGRTLTLILLLFIQYSWGMSNDILRLNLPPEPNLDPNTVCKTYPALTSRQYEHCFQHPDVTASAIQGIQVAIHECQHQLKDHRWNCSTLEKKNKNPHASPILGKGFRESAFAYAILAAGVTHQVAKACSMGKLQSCGCDMRQHGKVKDKWEWGGCSHNVEFGEKFSAKFLDVKERAKDIHAKINLHNNRAGRLSVIRNVRRKCKCHGMSGSCEIQTCWKSTPDFREVGIRLKKKYDAARKVKVNILNAAAARYRRIRRNTRKSDLIFYERSPNYCDVNPRVDSIGTSGRLCNKTSSGVNNCQTLCCGRGYNTLRVKRTERCDCKFHWCCYVVCKTCSYNEWVTVCK